MMLSVVFFLVFFEKTCNASPFVQDVDSPKTPKFPRFMKDIYNSVLTGRRRLSNIIHSNEAVGVWTSNTSFEAIFDDLSFTQREILKRARLRLNIQREQYCASDFTIRLMDGETHHVIDEYEYTARHNGVSSIPLTDSLKKLILAPTINKSLRVRVTFHGSNADDTACVKTVNELTKSMYLVTRTKERNQWRFRRDTESLPTYRRDTEEYPSTYHSVSKRRASSKTCTMRSVNVPLTTTNGSIALPHAFTTGVCGIWQPIPIGASPLVKEVARAIHKAIRNMAKTNDPICCVPTAFRKLAVMYVTGTHVGLRYLNRIRVVKCGCV